MSFRWPYIRVRHNMTVIHGYQPTDVECPHCHDSHGMRESVVRNGRTVVRYVCWCGASRIEPPEVEA